MRRPRASFFAVAWTTAPRTISATRSPPASSGSSAGRSGDGLPPFRRDARPGLFTDARPLAPLSVARALLRTVARGPGGRGASPPSRDADDTDASDGSSPCATRHWSFAQRPFARCFA